MHKRFITSISFVPHKLNSFSEEQKSKVCTLNFLVFINHGIFTSVGQYIALVFVSFTWRNEIYIFLHQICIRLLIYVINNIINYGCSKNLGFCKNSYELRIFPCKHTNSKIAPGDKITNMVSKSFHWFWCNIISKSVKWFWYHDGNFISNSHN